jgi:hypothetical protein
MVSQEVYLCFEEWLGRHERACCVAGAAAQGDGGLQSMTGCGYADRSAYVPAVPVRFTCARA